MIDAFLNIDTAKSYATEENLDAGLKRLGFDDLRPMKVRNRAGRWTAVFFRSFVGHDMVTVANAGFKIGG